MIDADIASPTSCLLQGGVYLDGRVKTHAPCRSEFIREAAWLIDADIASPTSCLL